ncbi:GtrA family protein [Xanthobacter sp. KR7-65]|uniref:GtrA family protein n=1 Tax=Xanthobacter sp. KR7-65 TaxID=3156612 RepID=UPI0032B38B8D
MLPPALAQTVARYRASHGDLVRQFATFVGVGLAAAAAHFSTLAVLVEMDALGPVLASAVGFVAGGTVSYVLNRRFTFEATRSHAGAVPRFIAVAGVAFGLNEALMWLFVHEVGLFYLLAQFLTTGITMMWTFTGYRAWAFAHRAGAHG